MSPSPPSQAVRPSKAAAAAIYDVVKDDVDFAATNDSSQNVGNFYDTIDDVPTASTSTPPQRQSPAEADSVYLHVQPRSSTAASTSSQLPSPPQSPPETDDDYPHRTNLKNDVPCLYELERVPAKSSDRAEPATAASLYESMDRPHLESSSASPSTSSPPPPQSPPDADNVYLEPRNTTNDGACFYELERVPTEPSDSAYAN